MVGFQIPTLIGSTVLVSFQITLPNVRASLTKVPESKKFIPEAKRCIPEVVIQPRQSRSTRFILIFDAHLVWMLKVPFGGGVVVVVFGNTKQLPYVVSSL